MCEFCGRSEPQIIFCANCGKYICKCCRSKTRLDYHEDCGIGSIVSGLDLHPSPNIAPYPDSRAIKDFVSGIIPAPDPKGILIENYILRGTNGKKIGIFKGISPRHVALKATKRGFTDIRLRKRNTRKVQLFKGVRVQATKSIGTNAWQTEKILGPSAGKIGIEKLEKSRRGSKK